MYKTVDANFEMSCGEQALQIVDKVAASTEVQKFPAIVAVFSKVRDRILNINGNFNIDFILSGVSGAIDKVLESLRLSADDELRMMASSVAEKVVEVRRKLTFLKDIFDDQFKNFKVRYDAGEKFAYLEATLFMFRNPQYSVHPITFNKRIRESFDSGFDELVRDMGFPLIVDLKDIQDVKMRISADLWRVYNKKNGFSHVNREYKPDSNLPVFREVIHYSRGFIACYGSFSNAVKEIILGEEIDFEAKVADDSDVGQDGDDVIESSPKNDDVIPKVRKKRERKFDENERQAMAKLAEFGHPFDGLSTQLKKCKPSVLLERAELMIELFGEVKISLLMRTTDIIRSFAKKFQRGKLDKNAADEKLSNFLAERNIDLPPSYLMKSGSARILEHIEGIEARGVPFKSEYWWWLNGAAAQRDAQIEETWRKLSKNDRRNELAEIYGFDVAAMYRTAVDAEPDNIRQYCKVLKAAGYDGRYQWSWSNRFPIAKFRYFVRDKLVDDSDENAEKWTLRINLAERLKPTVGAKIDKIDIEVVLEEADDAEVTALSDEDADYMAILKSVVLRVQRKKELEAVFRRYRFGYKDMDYFCENMERVEYAFAKIEELNRLKMPVTRDVMYAGLDGLVACENADNLTPEQRDIVIYLKNVGCDDLLAKRLVAGGETVEDFRAKVTFFRGVELSVEDCGKSSLDFSDYEDLLDKSLPSIKRIWITRLRNAIKNRFARERLGEALGDGAFAITGWRSTRTSPATMFQKLQFLQDGALKDRSAIVAELVAGYSKYSLKGITEFIDQICSKVDGMNIEPQLKVLYIQLMVGVLHGLTKTIGNGVVTQKMLDLAKNQMLAGDFDDDFFDKIRKHDKYSNVAELLVVYGDAMVKKVYEDVVGLSVNPAIVDKKNVLASLKSKFFAGYSGSSRKDRDFDVFIHRFGSGVDGKNLTLAELSKKLGIPLEKVRKIELGLLNFVRGNQEIMEMLQDLVE